MEVEPPGEQPTNTRPIATFSGRSNILANTKLNKGINPNWLSHPMTMLFQFLTSFLKSLMANVVPSPKPIMKIIGIKMFSSLNAAMMGDVGNEQQTEYSVGKKFNKNHSSQT